MGKPSDAVPVQSVDSSHEGMRQVTAAPHASLPTESAPLEYPLRKRWFWFALLTLLLVAIDQGMKIYATQHWKGLPPRTFMGDIFRISYELNEGAFLSLFAGLSASARFFILVVLNGIILLGVSVYILFARNVSKYVFFAFTLVVAGGLGNMIDRVLFGAVIDFFNLGIGGLRTGIFNIADMAITAGFLMMLPIALYGEQTTTRSDAALEKHPTPGNSSAVKDFRQVEQVTGSVRT